MLLCFCSHAGISYIAPHLNNLYFLTLCQRYGVYQVIRWLFMLKLGLSVAMLLAGADHIYLLCIFIARYGHAHTSAHTSGMCDSLSFGFVGLFCFKVRHQSWIYTAPHMKNTQNCSVHSIHKDTSRALSFTACFKGRLTNVVSKHCVNFSLLQDFFFQGKCKLCSTLGLNVDPFLWSL